MPTINDSILFLTWGVNFLIGFLVVLRARRSATNHFLVLFIGSILLWSISIYAGDHAGAESSALLWSKLTFLGAILAVAFLLLFTIEFTRFWTGNFLRRLVLILIAPTALGFFSLTSLIVKSVDISTVPIKLTYGVLYPAFGVYVLIYFAISIIILIRAFRNSRSLERLKLKFFVTGIIITVIFTVVTNLLLPSIGLSQFTGLGPVSTIIFFSLTAYSIIRHRLLDIVVIIKRATIFFILLSIILGIFSLIAFGLPAIFANNLPEETYQISMVAVAFIVALFFQPLRRAIEETTDKWFFKGSYNPQQVIDQLSEKISTIIDLRVLLDSTARILLSAFRADHAVFAVREKIGAERRTSNNESDEGETKTELAALSSAHFIAYNTEGRHHGDEEFGFDQKHPFVKFFTKYPTEIIVKDELQREVEELAGSVGRVARGKSKRGSKKTGEAVEVRLKASMLKEMDIHDFSIVFPIISKDELVGIFGIGEKKSGDIYSTQDIRLLELYSHQVGIAIENAKLYADLKSFNEKLQLEVEKATQDMRLANSQLTLRNKDLASLQKITNTITRTFDLTQIMQYIANSIHMEMGYAGGIINLYDKEKGTLRAAAITETPLIKKAIALLPISPYDYVGEVEKHHSLNTKTLKTGEVQIDPDFAKFVSPPVPTLLAKAVQKVIGAKTIIALPIFSEQEVIGVLNIGLQKAMGEITDAEIQMMKSLSDQTGIVIRNVRLYEAVRDYSQKLEEANAYLRELDQTKSEFISIASHQLRSPMTGIKGYLSMLISGDFGELDEQKKGILQQLFDSSERLIRLINIFLNVSRIEAGRLHLDKREMHIEDVVQSVVKEMTQPAKGKGLELSFDHPKKGSIPAFVADPDKLRDVILNFIDNAIKYTEKGKVWVEVETGPRPKEMIGMSADHGAGNTEKGVIVRVSDTGIGLSSEDIKKLFDKFSRVKGIAQINPDGSGLGLYIAKKLSEAHGGGVWVESKGKGKGSTFAMWVPEEAKA